MEKSKNATEEVCLNLLQEEQLNPEYLKKEQNNRILAYADKLQK